jgi:hypothetical protein
VHGVNQMDVKVPSNAGNRKPRGALRTHEVPLTDFREENATSISKNKHTSDTHTRTDIQTP